MTKQIGLRTDPLPIDQPKDSARFVLNGVLDSPEGDVLNYQNELGTDIAHSLPPGYSLIGAINMPDNDVAVFSTNNTESEIGVFNQGTYTAYVNTTCLNFSTSNLIKGVYKILNGCDRIIYWTDDFNDDKQLNLDDLTSYQDSAGNWDCNLFKLNPNYLIPEVTVNAVNDSGGSIEPGGYSFAVELLDSNLNSITVGFPTNYIPIYDDNSKSSYDTIFGALGSSTNAVEGGIDLTTKSVNLTFSNLDTRFDFVRLVVIAKNSGRGFAEEAYELTDYIPLSKDTIDYTFTGITNAVRTDVDAVRVKTIAYTVSKDMKIVDGRLARFNLKQNTRDYSGYQRVVNDITVNWGRTQTNPFDIALENNTRNPVSYHNGNTWIGDEIEALAVEFIHSDGTVSPAFHIPGRIATTTDTQLLTVVDGPTTGTNISEEDAQHLGLEVGDTIPRWKFENTATGVLSGNLGYHESATGVYPETLDCNGEPIYDDLAGTPIRHHRIPCRYVYPTSLENSAGEAQVNKFYLTFSNITYPDPDIVGHRFLRAKKNESERSVVDNGVLYGFVDVQLEDSPDVDDNYVFMYDVIDYAKDTSTEIVGITTPKILADKFQSAEYIKFLGYFDSTRLPSDDATRNSIAATTAIDSFKGNVNSMLTRYRNLVKSRVVNPNSILNGEFDRPAINRSFSNNKLICEMSDAIADAVNNCLILVSLKRDVDPHTNLYLIQYEPVTPILTLVDTQRTYQGGGFTNHLDYFDLYSVGVDSIGFLNTNSELALFSEYIRDVFVDSTINYELRVEGTLDNIHYDDSQNLGLYTISQVADFDGSNWVIQAGPSQQYYRINDDYSWDNGGTPSLPIPFNYDYCSSCLDTYPNRIAWSPKSFSEEKSDTYRINLVNDYTIIGEDSGEIVQAHYDKNRMLVLTRNSCFLLSPNPQVINTDVDAAYIGTGDFLSIPPAEFAKVNYGFGGCQGRFASVNTEEGFFWCDQQAGSIYVFNGQVDELSSKQYGNYGFFRKNLSEVYTNGTDSTVANAGIQMAYDPYYERIIIHKADYRFIGQVDDGDFADHNKYENLSWTMSFDPGFKFWISFHSWQPEFMFCDRNVLYTTESNRINSHTNSKTEFYGIKFPFIVEYVEANPMSNDLDVVAYYAQTVDETGLDKAYPTFDKAWCYSADQSTGDATLVGKTDYPPFWSNTVKPVAHAEQDYRISALRDLSTGSTVTSTAWVDRQSAYTGKQGYIDKVPVNIDTTTSQWNLIPLRNKYHIIRLGYSGSDRIILNLTETVIKPTVL